MEDERADPLGERIAVVENEIAGLRRDFDDEKLAREADHKRLAALELGMAKDVSEIKISLSTMAAAQKEMARDWREAYGDKREVKGRWFVLGLALTLFGGFVAKAIWDALTAGPPVIASPPHTDATRYARECSPDSGWPCEPSP